jgi:hypothetical protein
MSEYNEEAAHFRSFASAFEAAIMKKRKAEVEEEGAGEEEIEEKGPPLCRFCAGFDYDMLVSKKGYVHHATFAALEFSAAQNCQICSLVVDSTKNRRLDSKGFQDHLIRCIYTPSLQSFEWFGIAPSRSQDWEYVPFSTPTSDIIKFAELVICTTSGIFSLYFVSIYC